MASRPDPFVQLSVDFVWPLLAELVVNGSPATVTWPLGGPGPVVRVDAEIRSGSGHWVINGVCVDRATVSACAAEIACMHERLVLFAQDHGLQSGQDAVAYLGAYAQLRPPSVATVPRSTPEQITSAVARGERAPGDLDLRPGTYLRFVPDEQAPHPLAVHLGDPLHVAYLGAGIAPFDFKIVPDPLVKRHRIYGTSEGPVTTALRGCSCLQQTALPEHRCWHLQFVEWLEAERKDDLRACIAANYLGGGFWRRFFDPLATRRDP